MDKITITKLSIFANHGVYDFEKINGQKFYIDIDMFLDTSTMPDNIDCTVNYGEVCEEIKKFFTENTYDLIEYAGNALAKHLLVKYPKISKLTLTINKPDAPVYIPFENISVTISRGWNTAYLAVGSNLGDREKYITDAVNSIKNNENIRLLKTSTLIETEPYGVIDQPKFLNGAIKIQTIYTPQELLAFCKDLEKQANRQPTGRWRERTLDCDILLYNQEVIFTDELKIPHPEMHIRTFVLEPLAEIEPYLMHPTRHENISELLSKLK